MKRIRRLFEGWEVAQTADLERGPWFSASVPGHVTLDLVRYGAIADPFARLGEIGAQWVDETDWTYRTSFHWDASEHLPRRVLRFPGLDAVATVFLNGQEIARHDNAFVPLEVDVSDFLVEGENALEVRFESAARVGRERMAEYLAREGLPNPCPGFAERSFVRKPQYMFGWDWGPRLVSCGFSACPELVEYHARIRDLWVRQEHKEHGDVLLHLSCKVEGEPVDVQFELFAPDGSHVDWEQLQDEGGQNGFVTALYMVHAPELWWPNGMGAQPLYRVRATATSLAEHALLDFEEAQIGFRTVELRQEEDEFGRGFEFVVNGVRLYALGADWIPNHSFPSAVDANRLTDSLAAAKRHRVNMLRVWGGGLYESDLFYDLCDRLGLLVWQDFCYACALYPDDEAAQEQATIEAESNIKRLRNHASLATWCGNNENQMIYEAWYSKGVDRLYGDHLYHKAIPETLARLDPDRPYTPGSPWGKDERFADEVEPFRTNMGRVGSIHNWDVWHGRGDWRYYAESTGRFVTEFGFASSCGLATWNTCLAPDQRSARSQEVRWHDKTRKGYEKYLGMVKLHYPDPVSLEDLVFFTQLNQRDAMREALEHYRTSDFCRGNLIWQLNDCWPVQSWAMWDWLGHPKPAAHELKRIFAPLLLALKREGPRFLLWASLDNLPEGSLHAEVALHKVVLGESKRFAPSLFSFDIACGERQLLGEISIEGLPTLQTMVFAQMVSARAQGGREIPIEHGSAWRLAVEPKEAELPRPRIVISNAGARMLEVLAEGPVVDLVLWDAGGTTIFERNAFTWPWAKLFHVPYRGDPGKIVARSLAGEHEVILTSAPIT